MKICLCCNHFHLDEGWGGSDVTGPSPASITCRKGHFGYESVDSVVEVCLSKAVNCPDFELSDLAKQKGFTDEC